MKKHLEKNRLIFLQSPRKTLMHHYVSGIFNANKITSKYFFTLHLDYNEIHEKRTK